MLISKKTSYRVLIAPLDWGLGHTTRCIPLIYSFLQAACTVYVACNPVSKQLLQQEFSNIQFLSLDGYNISYASSKRKFAFKILQQIPKIIFAIAREHRWLKKTVIEHQIDLIISDNRYGLYHKRIPSVFITHQLFIKTPFIWLSNRVQKINYRYINHFTECWVPDYESELNIAGILSHPVKPPSVPLIYIGPLSRFVNKTEVQNKYKWLLLLSGPEPQRTILENLFLKNISSFDGKMLMIRGLPGSNHLPHVPDNCTVFNHLSTKELQVAFEQSEYIISRSGYTTVMEILSLQKKAILIPTPGQTEQEYLASRLLRQHWCYAWQQNEYITKHIQLAELFQYTLPHLPVTALEDVIAKTIKRYITG